MPIDNAELIIPPEAKRDPNSFEILRVWAAQDDQHVTIRSDLNGGAQEFGYMLAQLAHHGAKLYSQRDGVSAWKSMSEVLSGFNEEIKNNTGDPSGAILD